MNISNEDRNWNTVKDKTLHDIANDIADAKSFEAVVELLRLHLPHFTDDGANKGRERVPDDSSRTAPRGGESAPAAPAPPQAGGEAQLASDITKFVLSRIDGMFAMDGPDPALVASIAAGVADKLRAAQPRANGEEVQS